MTPATHCVIRCMKYTNTNTNTKYTNTNINMKYTKEDNRIMSAAPHCTAHNTQYTNTHHTIHDTPLEQIIRNMWHTIRDMCYTICDMWYVICDTWYTVHNKAKVLGGSFCVLEDVWGGYSTTQGIQITWHTIRYVVSRTTTCTRQAAVRYSIGHRGLGGSFCVLQDVCNQWAWGRWWGPLYANFNECKN